MKLSNALHVSVVAAGTALITLALLWPASVDAVDAAAAKIVQPTLNGDGWTVAMRSDKPSYGAGEKPSITLKCYNPTNRSVEADLQLAMEGLSPTSMESRMPARPMSLWKGNCPITLKAGETKEYVVPVGAAIPPAIFVSITMADGKAKSTPNGQAVTSKTVMLSLGMIAPAKPAAKPAVAQAAQPPVAQTATPRP